MIDNQILVPDGVKDYIPNDFIIKSELIKKIESTFLKYNYSLVETPMFEFIEVFEGKGSVHKNQMYKFIDRNGDVLTLRPDLTPPICRLVSANNLYKNTPLRLCYTGNTFRYNENYQGKLREFTQSGAELMGSKDATIEILDMAINSLITIGLNNFRLDISQINFFEGLTEESSITKKDIVTLQKYLINKNFVAVSEMAKSINIPNKIKQFLCNIHAFIGKTDVIENAKNYFTNKKSLDALDNLLDIFDKLKLLGIDKYINFDLSMIGKLDYYTGIIISGYTYGTGFSILDGGQYDNLMKQFGHDLSAIGFSMKINNLMQALENQDVRRLS